MSTVGLRGRQRSSGTGDTLVRPGRVRCIGVDVSARRSCRQILGHLLSRTAGLLLLLANAGTSHAASSYTEHFSTGLAGWVARQGTMSLRGTNGLARATFAAQPVQFPEIDALVASNTASGGAFTGDWGASDLRLLTIAIRANQVLPSDVTLRLYGVTNSFFRNLTAFIATTGQWHVIRLSAASRSTGRWNGGGDEAFEALLRDVRKLEVQLTRSGTSAQEYDVDLVRLEPLPEVGVPSQEGPSLTCSARNLVTGAVYRLDVSTDLMTWQDAGTFVATNATHVFEVPSAGNVQALRLGF